MIRAHRAGIAGFVVIAFGMHKMTPSELLSFANLAAHQGRHGLAAIAMDELAARYA